MRFCSRFPHQRGWGLGVALFGVVGMWLVVMFLTACRPRNVHFFIWHGTLENETTKLPRNVRRQSPNDFSTYTVISKTLNAIFVQNVDVLHVKVDGAYIHHSLSFELHHLWYEIRTLLLHSYKTQYCHNASAGLDILSVHQAVRVQQPRSHRRMFNQKW